MTRGHLLRALGATPLAAAVASLAGRLAPAAPTMSAVCFTEFRELGENVLAMKLNPAGILAAARELAHVR